MPRRTSTVWARNIRALTEASDISATKIAAKAGMTIQQFSNLTNDPKANPSVTTLQRVADALGVDVAELFRSGVKPNERAHDDDDRRTAIPARETLVTAIRDALRDILADILRGLAAADGPSDESTTGARTAKTQDGDLSIGA